MLQCVRITNDGNCTQHNVTRKKTQMFSLTKNKQTQIYSHFTDHDHKICVYCETPIEKMTSNVALFTLCTPPPFSRYLFATPVYVLGYSGDCATSMTYDHFCTLHNEWLNISAPNQKAVAVYDVPLNTQPTGNDSSDEETDDEDSIGDDDVILDDDRTWLSDDDDVECDSKIACN